MQAVIFGAGNIGRGFIGQLFSESGCEISFVDVDDELVAALTERGSYHLQTVFNEDVLDYTIAPVRAIHGKDIDAVAQCVSRAAIGATAVGAAALKHVAPAIAAGIRLRRAADAGPLNLIICENLKGAAGHMRSLVDEHLTEEERQYATAQVGFVDTVIGRMVPMPTAEMRARDVSMIRVEPYKELPVDRNGFVGRVPSIVAMEAHDNFPLFTARKLYVHNCGHALLAYTGYLKGYEYGYEAMQDSSVRQLMNGGLAESIQGIVAEYDADPEWLEAHRVDLMARFANRVLADTIFRLGRDPVRKLGAADRLAGPARLAASHGHVPRHLAWGIASAFCFAAPEDPSAQALQQRIAKQGIAKTLRATTGIEDSSVLGERILAYYDTLRLTPRADFPG